MIAQKTIATPSNTYKTELKETELKLTSGIIYQIDVYFPPGSSGLTGVAIYYNSVQVYPNIIGEFFVGDNINISFPDILPLDELPYNLVIMSYNIDTVYSHSVYIRVGYETNPNIINKYLQSDESRIVNVIENIKRNDEDIRLDKVSKMMKRKKDEIF